ncbi:integrase core domain-containing protein [Bradyrhizobium sp. CCBAU 45384]|uniref:integrase core domain-containing protein n=1 Tax=Bradyrhizobium sp. CCBAU 45384 TaxID=858428 RepID=UPI003FA4D129
MPARNPPQIVSAKAESFTKTLKAEPINGKAFADLGDARRHITCFIAEVYNKVRLHSALRRRREIRHLVKRQIIRSSAPLPA